MKNILIICEAGISASLMLNKLVKEIEKRNLKYSVDYATVLSVETKLTSGGFDYLVFTPQVRRYEERVRSVMAQCSCEAQMVFLTDEEFNYMKISEILEQIQRM